MDLGECRIGTRAGQFCKCGEFLIRENDSRMVLGSKEGVVRLRRIDRRLRSIFPFRLVKAAVSRTEKGEFLFGTASHKQGGHSDK